MRQMRHPPVSNTHMLLAFAPHLRSIIREAINESFNYSSMFVNIYSFHYNFSSSFKNYGGGVYDDKCCQGVSDTDHGL